MSEIEIKQAYEKIQKCLQKIYKEIEKAQSIADQYGLSFRFDLQDRIGGTYRGKVPQSIKDEWTPSTQDCYTYDSLEGKWENDIPENTDDYWQSSSRSC